LGEIEVGRFKLDWERFDGDSGPEIDERVTLGEYKKHNGDKLKGNEHLYGGAFIIFRMKMEAPNLRVEPKKSYDFTDAIKYDYEKKIE